MGVAVVVAAIMGVAVVDAAGGPGDHRGRRVPALAPALVVDLGLPLPPTKQIDPEPRGEHLPRDHYDGMSRTPELTVTQALLKGRRCCVCGTMGVVATAMVTAIVWFTVRIRSARLPPTYPLN